MARKLAANVHVGDQFFAAGSTPPKEFADQITNPKAWGTGESSAVEEEAGDKPYSEQTVKQLKAEIDRRNEGRAEEDLIEPDGTKKDDLVAALEADDDANE